MCYFACFLGLFYQNFACLINARFRDMLTFLLWSVAENMPFLVSFKSIEQVL